MSVIAIPDEIRPRRPLAELLALAAPMIGISISRMAMGFIDFAMVSALDSTAAQAAISPATLLVFAIGCIGMGIAQSVQTYVSQADGRGEPERCGGYAWQVFYIALAMLVVTLPLVLTTRIWFGALGVQFAHPADMLEQEIRYLQIALWSIAPAVVCMGLENFFNGIKRPNVALVAVLASLVVNVIGNWVFMWGKLGMPELGIAGAALATVLAWGVRVAILAAALFRPSVDARYRTIGAWRLDLAKQRDLLRIGTPTAFQWLIDIGAWVVFMHAIMPHYGTAVMAATNIAVQFMHLSFMPALGVGQAMTTQVGNAIGAGHPDLAVLRMRVARRLIVGYMGSMSLLFVLAGDLMSLVFTLDPAVLAAAGVIMVWVGLFQFSDGVCVTYSFALRGAGDTRVPAVLFAICCWGIFIGGGLAVMALLPGWGLHGPWMMCTAYIVTLGGLLWRRFHGEAWRKIRLFEERSTAARPDAGETAAEAPRSAEVAEVF